MKINIILDDCEEISAIGYAKAVIEIPGLNIEDIIEIRDHLTAYCAARTREYSLAHKICGGTKP